MNERNGARNSPLSTADLSLPIRVTRSALAREHGVMSLADFEWWFADRRRADTSTVRRIPFAELEGWRFREPDGNLVHESGKFFTIEGLAVARPDGPIPGWAQPIINQPEIGILGFLVKEFDGVLHCLVQAKMEPGNSNGLQLSPTVQATRSNYTRVHKGNAVPYLDYFVHAERHRVLADVLQSEQGSWFYRKRNRNMIVEVEDDVEVLDGFCWLTVGQLHRLLAVDHMVNMDARTVLSCLPSAGVGLVEAFHQPQDAFGRSLMRSFSADEGALHTIGDILSWITKSRALHEIQTTKIALDAVESWRRTPRTLEHETGLFFDVIAVEVVADNREVRRWTQPMIAPHGVGVVAFLVCDIGGVLHVLVNARVEPGYLDVVELAPTVQCAPENYAAFPESARPPFLDLVLDVPREHVIFEAVQSEEGGRFYHAHARYMLIMVDDAWRLDLPPDFRWMTAQQLAELNRHSHYVNVQARSLLACLYSLTAASGDGAAGERRHG